MYQDAGAGAAAPKKKGGCLKWGGIGCGVIVVILIIVMAVVYTQRGKLLNMAGDWMKNQILEALPEGFDTAEASEVMEAFYNGLKEEKVTEADIQQLSSKFQAAMQDGSLSNEEAEDLLNFMREKAGLDAPADMDEPLEEGWEEDEPVGEAEATAADATEL